MCGIIGIQSQQRVEPLLVEALSQMEYRGYDSAGIATLSRRGVEVRRAAGPLDNLKTALNFAPAFGHVGLGHTRWATHGGPVSKNAHPHLAGHLSLVHNGVVENVDALRRLLPADVVLHSDTDSEVIAQLLADQCDDAPLTLKTLNQVLRLLKGATALLVLDERQPDRMFFAKRGSPLLVCRSIDGGLRASSDVAAFGEDSPLVHVVEDGCVGWLDGHTVHVERDEEVCHPSFMPVTIDVPDVDSHPCDMNTETYMEREMREQPAVMRHLAKVYGDESEVTALLDLDATGIDHVHFVACGSSHYAACTVAGRFESQVRVLTTVSLASEFRYRNPHLTPRTLVVGVSQSGETADTLAALEHARDAGSQVLVFTNVGHSTMARVGSESAGALPLCAGREVCVASTKAFSAQVATLYIFGLWMARQRGADVTWDVDQLLEDAAADYDANLDHWRTMETLAASLDDDEDLLLLGRGALYAVALEGALKIKELAYMRAEGFAAGELKHGPLALVSEGTPVLAIIDDSEAGAKTALALDEVAARGGNLFVVTPAHHDALERHPGVGLDAASSASYSLQVSCMLQVLALHLAQRRGCNVDKPRNLAKSVTVE